MSHQCQEDDSIECNNNIEKLDHCEICIKGKLSRLPFPIRKTSNAVELLHTIHSDVCGPFRVKSPGGAQYYVSFTDECSRYTYIYFLRHKNEVLEKFKIYKNEVENFVGQKIKFFQTDNGRAEYCNKDFDKYLEDCGIQRRLSAPRTPQQNGLAERKNRVIIEKARCLLIGSNLSETFWAEAVNTSNYLINRSPSRSLNSITPFQRWVGHAPSVRHFQEFGIQAFVLNKKQNKSKFDPRAEPGIFMGYSQVSKAYRIWMPQERKIVISRDVRFINKIGCENPLQKCETEKLLDYSDEPNDNHVHIYIQNSNEKETTAVKGTDDSNEATSDSEDEFLCFESPEDNKRTRKLPLWTKDYDMSHQCQEDDSIECNNPDYWTAAIQDEFIAHIQNDTWSIVDRKKDQKAVSCRMVLKNKLNADGTIERPKARLVARGFSQQPNVDFSETFAPVAKLSSIRFLIALAAEENLSIHQMDVTTAYLNGELDEQLFMEIPTDLEKFLQEILINSSETDEELYTKAKQMLNDLRRGGSNKVCLLKKALYGLKQAGRSWFRKLDHTLKDIGFKPSNADPCMFIREADNSKVIISVYVDDLIIASSSQKLLNETKEKLKVNFKIRDLGELKYCLGMEFSQQNDKIIINQQKYIENILKKFGMQECKHVKTPIETGIQFSSDACDAAQTQPYQNLIGSLMYLSVATRPDISFAVSYLSQFNSCYNEQHWAAAKRILRYLQGSKDVSLIYKKTGNPIIGHADADWGSCNIDRRSYTGFIFKFGGGPISWESRKQRAVALSTAESEYVAITEASKEAIHLRRLANDLGYHHEKIIIFNDNQAAKSLCTNPIVSSKSKHIDIKMHFIREKVLDGEIEIAYIRSEDMEADILTKPLPGPRFTELKKMIGLHQPYHL